MLSGHKFGADYDMPMKQNVLLDEQEIAPPTNGVMLFWLNPAQSASQGM